MQSLSLNSTKTRCNADHVSGHLEFLSLKQMVQINGIYQRIHFLVLYNNDVKFLHNKTHLGVGNSSEPNFGPPSWIFQNVELMPLFFTISPRTVLMPKVFTTHFNQWTTPGIIKCILNSKMHNWPMTNILVHTRQFRRHLVHLSTNH